MKGNPLVSIIIRTKNEERWISSCLKSVYRQKYKNIEVIIVDNNSTDKTLKIASEFPLKIVTIKKFLPGKAINLGIRSSSGEYLVCLSGHCIPTNNNWLENLVLKLTDPKIAGVYGRQEPLSYTNDLDKRDLLTVFGLDPRIQVKDSFFHNANSAFTREMWSKFPFDEEVTNIEDRVWGVEVINSGFNIAYEPKASVFHWHGINHGLNQKRAKKIVKILEKIEGFTTKNKHFEDVSKLNTVAIIPIRGESLKINNKYLLEYTMEAVEKSDYLSEVYVVTDSLLTAKIATEMGAKAPFLRPLELSEEYVEGLEVVRFMLEKIEENGTNPDLVCCLSETYPFRMPNLIDNMIRQVFSEGLDTLIASKIETRSIWIEKNSEFNMVSNGFIPRQMQDSKALLGLWGLCCVTHPVALRGPNLLGGRDGFYKINDPCSSLQIRNEEDITNLQGVLSGWWNKNY